MSVDQNDKNSRLERANRVKRLKRLILILVTVLIITPIILCVMLLCKFTQLEKQVEELKKTQEVTVLQQESRKRQQAAAQTTLSANILENKSDGSSAAEKQNYEEDTRRRVYFTFDDGPSENTSKILDILAEYHVKATFFVVGKTDPASVENYRRIVAEGHTLGMHSYSHKYNEIYASQEAYIEDLTKLRDYLYDITGVKAKYVRFPGGSSNQVSQVDMQVLIDYLEENNITYFDWNISSGDANASRVSVKRIISNCMDKLEEFNSEAMILMHDANDKQSTVEALPIMIEQIQEMDDTVLLPITEETIPIRHVRREDTEEP